MNTYLSKCFSDVESEFSKTRSMLERVPNEHLDWRPHEKSWTLIQLATHIANLPQWIVMTIKEDGFDMAASFPRPPAPLNRDELLVLFDTNKQAALEALHSATDQELESPWALRNGGFEIWSRSSHKVVREFGINHTAHHRGQLSVYLRLLNVPLPPIYGPTADEQPG